MYVFNVSVVSNRMLQVFLFGCCICCIGYTCMLQVYVSNVSAGLKHMLQVFYLNVAYVAVPIHVLQTYIVMFHLFRTYVASVLWANVCCKCFMSKRRQRWSPRVQRARGKRSRRDNKHGSRCGARHGCRLGAWGEAEARTCIYIGALRVLLLLLKIGG